MKTIILASRKGGAAETTLACHIAVEAERSGYGPAALIDTDPMQGAATWWDARAAETPVLASVGKSVPATLKALKAAGIALVVVDTPPSADSAVAALLPHADLVIVPVQPSPHDLRAVGSTVDFVNRGKRPMVFVVTRAKPRARLAAEAAVELSQHGTVAPVSIPDRTAYAAAAIDGRTAPEMDPNGPAAAEIATLWTYLRKRMEALA